MKTAKCKPFNYKKRCLFKLLLSINLFIMISQASTQLIPHGISGTVYISDNFTQILEGTNFSIQDITNGDIIAGTTDGPPGFNGRYSVSINGNNADK